MMASSEESRQDRPTSITGVLLLTLIVLAVAFWMRSQRPVANSSTSAAQSPPPSPSALAGVRPDAWYLPDDDLLGFVAIPAGPFAMGSDAGRDANAFDNEWWSPDRTPGTVDVAAFYIGRFEVTVAQLGAFADASGFVLDAAALDGPPDHPAANVSWPDALAYCRWLDGALRGSPITPPGIRRLLDDGWQVTLPSEAQWEKAARGTDGRVFPWGDEPRSDRANFGTAGPTRVGSFACPECPYGLSDMSGNVWEWTRSPYVPYPLGPDSSPDLGADALWVMRGGHYGDDARYVRAAVRGGGDPGARRPFIGFRVAVTP